MGLCYVDVWVEREKILLEIKVAPAIAPVHKAQALSYLKVTDADLAMVVNYGGPSLEDERLPNFLRDKQPEFVWQAHALRQGNQAAVERLKAYVRRLGLKLGLLANFHGTRPTIRPVRIS